MLGCCTDKSCTDKTCMKLPEGTNCGMCIYISHCTALFGQKPEAITCDYFPCRYTTRKLINIARAAWLETFRPVHKGDPHENEELKKTWEDMLVKNLQECDTFARIADAVIKEYKKNEN